MGGMSSIIHSNTNDTGKGVAADNFSAKAQNIVNLSMQQDAPQKILELTDMYTQLNRMVENLIRRVADQERRLNTVTQSGIVMDHYTGQSQIG